MRTRLVFLPATCTLMRVYTSKIWQLEHYKGKYMYVTCICRPQPTKTSSVFATHTLTVFINQTLVLFTT